MTEEEREDEGAEEAIEDLEAPAQAQDDVAGGAGACPNKLSCVTPSMRCAAPTCKDTKAQCMDAPATHDIIVYAQ